MSSDVVKGQSMRDAATQYLSSGLCVLPAVLQEKRPALPAWRSFQNTRPSAEQVRLWFESGAQALCLVCGAVSGHLETIDFDGGGDRFDAWCKRIPPSLLSRVVIERTPSRGFHVSYQSEVPVCGNLKLAQRQHFVAPEDIQVDAAGAATVQLHGKRYLVRTDAAGRRYVILTLIETRGEGGLFLCAPTPGYELIQGDYSHLPVLTEAERDTLLQAAWELNEYVPPVIDGAKAPPAHDTTERPGDQFNRRGDPRKILEQHGWTRVKGGQNEYWRRPGKDHGWSATLKDGVFYVFSVNAAPFESDRAYSPFAVYSLLEHGGDWSRAAAALRLQGYGPPPNSMAHTPAGTTNPPETPVAAMQPLTVRDLMVKYPDLRKPVIHGLLREGETMNVIAPPKYRKSWLVMDLALSVATGREWLGHFMCERGEVLILDNELHGETSANRIPKVAHARSVPTDAYADHVWVMNLRGYLQDVFSLGEFFRGLQPGRFKVVILDAFYRFMPRDMDENDNGTMASLYNHIDRYADLLGCCFVLIHHTTKGSQSGKSVTDVGAGAGSQSRATDTHMILRAHEEDDTVVLDAAVRSWPPVAPRCLRWSYPVWSPADDLDPAQLRTESGKKRGEKKDEWTVETFVQAFVGPRPATRSSILDKAIEAGLSHWLADRLLRSADDDGLVTRQGEGKRNDPYTYQLAVTTHEENGQ